MVVPFLGIEDFEAEIPSDEHGENSLSFQSTRCERNLMNRASPSTPLPPDESTGCLTKNDQLRSNFLFCLLCVSFSFSLHVRHFSFLLLVVDYFVLAELHRRRVGSTPGA